MPLTFNLPPWFQALFKAGRPPADPRYLAAAATSPRADW